MIDEQQVYQDFYNDLTKAIEGLDEADALPLPSIPEFIDENVWDMTMKYQRMMMTTKEKFFEYLNNKIPVSEYEKAVHELWDSIDHSYMDKAIKELQMITTTRDLHNAELYANKRVTQRSIKLQNGWEEYKLTDEKLYPLNPERDFITMEQRYVNRHIKYYENTLKRYSNASSEELVKLVKQYDKIDKSVPYYDHKTGQIRCYQTIGTYNSMLYNVNLLRASWNRTAYDSMLLDNHLWYLPAHAYACPHCMEYQGKVYTDDPRDKRYPQKETALEGGIGHPNCKHDWTLYWSEEQIQDEKYNSAEWEEKYKAKQKIQNIDLTKSRLLADRRIYKELGDEGLVDETSARIKALREKKKELEAQL